MSRKTKYWSTVIFLIISLCTLGFVIYYLMYGFGVSDEIVGYMSYEGPIWLENNFDNPTALMSELQEKDIVSSDSAIELHSIQDLNSIDENHAYIMQQPDGAVGYVNKKDMPNISEPSKVPLTVALMYELKRDTNLESPLLTADINTLQSYYDNAKITANSGDSKIKDALGVFIEARNNQEENEHIGDYDTLQNAYLQLISSFMNELTLNTERYRKYLSEEMYDIFSCNNLDISGSNPMEDILDRFVDLGDTYWDEESGEVNLAGVKLNPESLNVYRSLAMSNEFVKYQYSDTNANVYNLDCYKYGLMLYSAALTDNPDIEKYIKHQTRIKNGEVADIPEIEEIEESNVPIKNYLTEPYELNFANRKEAPGNIRFIRQPDTKKILVSLIDFNDYYGSNYTVEDMHYETAQEESTDLTFIDLSDINLLTGDIWYYDVDMEKLYIQKPLVYDSSTNEEFFHSIEGYPLPVVLINMEAGRANPTDMDEYVAFIDGILAHSYTNGYDDLVYALQDYMRCMQYYDLYADEGEDTIENTLMNYHYYLVEGLRDGKSFNFLTTPVKNFLDFSTGQKIVPYNEDNIRAFIDKVRSNEYTDVEIPEGCEGIYKALKFVYENSYNGNFPETAYPNIEMSQLSGLSLSIFMHDCHDLTEFYDIWNGKDKTSQED